MANKPTPPSSTNPPDIKNLEDIDSLSADQLADYLYDLAEQVISDPQAYKLKFGLSELDIAELDSIDLATAAGRKKLAKLFRLLAQQAFKGKEIYMKTVVDKSAGQGRGR